MAKKIDGRLDPKRLGLAAGIIFGIYLFASTLIAVWTGYGATALNMWADLHPGYSISIVGSVVALIYGFICGFVVLYVFGWLYNYLQKLKRSKL